MLTLLQCRKLGRVHSCLYYSELEEEGIKLRDKKVIQVRVLDWHPFRSDIFNEDGTLDRRILERIDLKSVTADVLFEKEYYTEDEYDDNDNLIREGELITDEDRIMQLNDERFQANRDWVEITDEEIEELYQQANWEDKE